MADPQSPKQPLPDDKLQELSQAWKDSEQLPDADKQGFRQFLQAKHADYVQNFDPPIDKRDSGLNWVANRGLEAADYGSGLVRTGILAPPSAAITAYQKGPKEAAVQLGQDITDAVNPFDKKTAPSALEYAKRAGIPEGYHASDIPGVKEMYANPGEGAPLQPEKGGLFDPSLRGAGALTLDTLLSPYGVGLLRNAAKGVPAALTAKQAALQAAESGAAPTLGEKVVDGLKVAADPATALTQKAGDTMYNSVFKDADNLPKAKYSVKAGTADPLSQVAKENNVWGSGPARADQFSKIMDTNQASNTDIAKNLTSGDLQPTKVSDFLKQSLEKLREKSMGNSAYSAAGKKAEERLVQEFTDTYGQNASLNPELLDELRKSYQNKAALQGAFQPQSQNVSSAIKAGENGVESQAMRDAYSGAAHTARTLTEDNLDKMGPGLGGDYYQNNREMSSIMKARPAIEKAAQSSGAGQYLADNAPRLLSGAAIGAGAGMAARGFDPATMALLAAAGAGLTSETARTGLGLALSKNAGLISNLGRARADETRGDNMRKPSPWTVLGQQMNQGK